MIDDNQREILLRQYIAVTKDADALINREMLGVLMKTIGKDITDIELDNLIKEVDSDGNGLMDFEEFYEAVKKKPRDSEEKVKEAFNVFDRNETGYIHPEDVRHIFLSLGENYSLQEVVDMLQLIDTDGDGCINFQEFIKIINDE